jgi:hypothetical protein
MLIVEQFSMVNRGTFQEGSGALAYGQELFVELVALSFLTDAVEALAKSLRHCSGHRLAGFASELLGEFVSFGIFDVEAHLSTILDLFLPVYHAVPKCGRLSELRDRERKSD